MFAGGGSAWGRQVLELQEGQAEAEAVQGWLHFVWRGSAWGLSLEEEEGCGELAAWQGSAILPLPNGVILVCLMCVAQLHAQVHCTVYLALSANPWEFTHSRPYCQHCRFFHAC